MSVNPIPDGYRTVTPYLIVDDADALVEFIEKTFDGNLFCKMQNEAGRIIHGEMQIGDSKIMLSEASDEWKAMPTMIHIYVPNIDETYQKALTNGAESVKEPVDQFYGDRNASVRDSQGNLWGIATHIEDVTEEEMARRASGS